MSLENKTCQNCGAEFDITGDDLNFYAKISVPPPTFCWLCRAQRRMAFRNERILYKRKSDFSGKDIFSMYAPASAGASADTKVSADRLADRSFFGAFEALLADCSLLITTFFLASAILCSFHEQKVIGARL